MGILKIYSFRGVAQNGGAELSQDYLTKKIRPANAGRDSYEMLALGMNRDCGQGIPLHLNLNGIPLLHLIGEDQLGGQGLHILLNIPL